MNSHNEVPHVPIFFFLITSNYGSCYRALSLDRRLVFPPPNVHVPQSLLAGKALSSSGSFQSLFSESVVLSN